MTAIRPLGQAGAAVSINPAFSLYLDFLRALAALWVMLSHLPLMLAGAKAPSWLPASGHDAVILFFVLSGYVISYSAQAKRAAGLSGYALDRAARIASVAVPMLLLSLLVIWLVHRLDGTALPYPFAKLWLYLPMYLSFTHQFWWLKEVPPALLPYWTLSFEVWYYVLFGLLAFARTPLRLALAGFVLVLVGYKIWLLAPAWLAGVALQRGTAGANWSVAGARALLITSFIIYLLAEWTGLDTRLGEASQVLWNAHVGLPLGETRRFLADYLVAALVTLHIAAARAHPPGLWRFERVIRWLAGISFTLYLAHLPIISLLASLRPPLERLGPSLSCLIAAAIILALTAALAPWTEGKRGLWRAALASLVDLGRVKRARGM